MEDWTGIDLSLQQIRRTTKKPIQVPVAFADVYGTRMISGEERTYRKGDALLTGTRGEQLPVQRHKFFG